MRMSDAFPSNYMKASDLRGDTVVTIDRVEMEIVGQGRQAEKKPVVYFRQHDKGLVLNKTNANTIAKIAGSEEMDEWGGRRITLWPTDVESGGELVMGIRVRLVNPPGAASRVPSLNEVKVTTFRKFLALFPGKTTTDFKAALEAFYPDRQPEQLSALDLQAASAANFERAEDPLPPAGQEFVLDDIPF